MRPANTLSRLHQGYGVPRDNVFHLKIAPWVIEHTANGQQAEFFVVLADQADLRPAATLATKAEKGPLCVTRCAKEPGNSGTDSAMVARARDRASLLLHCECDFSEGQSRDRRSVGGASGCGASGRQSTHSKCASQPEASDQSSSQPQTPETIEPGIAYTHAPDVWALGFRGQGITVAGADTGQRWTHNALKPHYRGWDGVTADHNYNWHDSIHDSVGNPCGNNSPFPCDDNGHGTHTIGTAVGDDGMGNQIGMAPGARWIGCRNMDQGNGTPARYIECMEWFLAPYPIGGGQGDPLRAPDITSNSWVCPPSEGCSANTLQAAVEAQAAAGIMMVAGAGNDGPSCSTVMYPPAIYAASYTVGALNTGTGQHCFL